MNKDIVDTLVEYFYKAPYVNFTKEREIKFREVLDFCYENYSKTEVELYYHYKNYCLNKNAFITEHTLFYSMCHRSPILNKKWVQHKKTEVYKK